MVYFPTFGRKKHLVDIYGKYTRSKTSSLPLKIDGWKMILSFWGGGLCFWGRTVGLGRVGKYTMGNLAGFYPRHVLKSAGFPRDWATLLNAWMLPCKVDRIFAQRQVPSKRPKEKGLCGASVMTLQASCFPILPENKTLNLKKAAPLGKHTKETSTRLPFPSSVFRGIHFPNPLASSHPLKLLHLVIANRLDGSLSPAGDSSWSGLDICRNCVCLSIFHQRLRRLNKWHTCWHIYI